MRWREGLGKALVRLGTQIYSEPVQLAPEPTPLAPAPPPDANDLGQLFHDALTAETPESLVEFAEFCARFRRHSIFNVRLIQVQRRGARACATQREWRRAGRYILPDAQPIIILWPFGPVAHVYDIEDTGPPHNRAAVGDPFAATSVTSDARLASALERLRKGCATAKQFRIDIVGGRLGWGFAGSAAGQGALPVPLPDDMAARAHTLVQGAAAERRKMGTGKAVRWIPSWRVKINDRMTAAEQLVTVAHELGHIFCGHLGGCGREADTAGWPERPGLPEATKEMEAEAVAWLVAQRAGVMSNSAGYLKRYVDEGGATGVSTDLVVRAASRIESLAGLRY